MEDRHDLTFVAPERRAEVLRRIRAIEAFIQKPGRAAAERAAENLGLKAAQFYNLVRAWKTTRRPEKIIRGGPRSKGPSVDPLQRDLMDAVIARSGRLPAAGMVDAIIAEAASKEVELPGRETLSRYVRLTRPSLLLQDVKSRFDLIVDHTVIDLPVDFGAPAPLRPLATIVIDVATDAVVGLALSAGTPGPGSTARALLDAMSRGLRPGGARQERLRIGIVAKEAGEIAGVDEALARASVEVRVETTGDYGGGRHVEALLGYRSAGLAFLPRLVWNLRGHGRGRREVTLAPGSLPMSPVVAEELARARLVAAAVTAAFARIDATAWTRLTNDLAQAAQAEA